jgi:hypothetical protein
MQSSRSNIHIFCSIQIQRHIDTSSMKYLINHSMQTSRNGIHMFCSIQNHIHTDTFSMKTNINHKSCHACLLSVFLVLLLMPMRLNFTELVLHFSCQWCFNPNSLTLHCANGTSTQTVLLMRLMRLLSN